MVRVLVMMMVMMMVMVMVMVVAAMKMTTEWLLVALDTRSSWRLSLTMDTGQCTALFTVHSAHKLQCTQTTVYTNHSAHCTVTHDGHHCIVLLIVALHICAGDG